MRSPRRTAQTSSALMVGLALVSTIAVFGASLSKSATSSVDNAMSADYIITGSGTGAGGSRHSVARGRGTVPGVSPPPRPSTTASSRSDGSLSTLTAVSTDHLAETVILRMDAGSRGRGPGRRSAADRLHHGQLQSPVGGVDGAGEVRPDRAARPCGSAGSSSPTRCWAATWWATGSSCPTSTNPCRWRSCSIPAGAPRPPTHAVKAGLSAYPNLKIQTRAEFEKSQQHQVNQLLGLVYALLALAVVIALIGIVNTLMLSVFERTHEIGLLRAVGMRRRQVRAMIRSESVILSLFGAIIGVVVGTALGVAFASSLKQQGITDLVDPLREPGGVPGAGRPSSGWARPAGRPDGRPSSTCWRPSPPSESHRADGRPPTSVRVGTPDQADCSSCSRSSRALGRRASSACGPARPTPA